jgi:hypothetical protein
MISKRYLALISVLGLTIVIVTAVAISVLGTNTHIDVNENIPADFIQVSRDIQRGIYYNFANLSEEYYKNPDFYPTSKQNLESQKNHDYGRWGVHGYGAYPGEIFLSSKRIDAGQSITVYTIVHTGYDVETFQGIKLSLKDQSGSFDTYVTPENILLTPTFPEFTDGWAHKIKIDLVAKQDIPAGTYKFKMGVDTPDGNTQEQFYKLMQETKYIPYDCTNCNNDIVELRKRVYVDGGMISSEKFFDFILDVG